MQTSSEFPSQVAANTSAAAPIDRRGLERQIRELGDWFHNLDLFGVSTAPNHFLGDFPRVKWKYISEALPADFSGAQVLDIGCNGGFYSVEIKRRGADRVLGIDVDDRYLTQARFAAHTLGLDIEFERRSVYGVDEIPSKFDYVFFMGVFYHLRYPLFALDKVISRIRPGGKLIFQTMLRGAMTAKQWDKNYAFWNMEIFKDQEYPAMYFIENQYAGDPTNWWIPNRGAAEAMLRSSGLEILDHPESETWITTPCAIERDGKSLLQHELDGTL